MILTFDFNHLFMPAPFNHDRYRFLLLALRIFLRLLLNYNYPILGLLWVLLLFSEKLRVGPRFLLTHQLLRLRDVPISQGIRSHLLQNRTQTSVFGFLFLLRRLLLVFYMDAVRFLEFKGAQLLIDHLSLEGFGGNLTKLNFRYQDFLNT